MYRNVDDFPQAIDIFLTSLLASLNACTVLPAEHLSELVSAQDMEWGYLGSSD